MRDYALNEAESIDLFRQRSRAASGVPSRKPRNRKSARQALAGRPDAARRDGGRGGWLWYTGRNIESTDDAYTDGRAVLIAPQVAGSVISLMLPTINLSARATR